MAAWLSANEIAQHLGITRQGVHWKARKEGWPSRWRRSNGGRRREYLLECLPETVSTPILRTGETPGREAAAGLGRLSTSLKALSLSKGSPERPSHGDARGAVNRPRSPSPRFASLSQAPESYRRVAEMRARILIDWESRAARFSRALADSIDPHWGVSARTLWRWKKSNASHGLLGLLPRWRGPASSIPEEAWAVFISVYLDQNRPSAEDAYERALLAWAADHAGDVTAVPSVSAFRRRVKDMPAAALLYYREGPKAYSDRAEPFLTRDFEEIAAGDEFDLDHHPLDFYARMENGKPGRFSVTAAQDMGSRKWVGWSLVETPSTDSILATLASAVARYGAPKIAWMDNGKDFRGREIAGGAKRGRFDKAQIDETRVTPICAELGIDPHFVKKYSGRSKPIERGFRNIADRFSKWWESYCGRSTATRPEDARYWYRHPELLPAKAIVLEKLNEFLEAEDNRPHRGAGMNGRTPNEVWEACRGEIRPVDPARLAFLALRQARPQKVKRNGVCLFSKLWYWNEKLTFHLEKSVVVRYDSADLSRVWVFDHDGRLLEEVERSDLAGVSRKDIGKAISRQRRTGRMVREAYAPEGRDWKYNVAAAASEPPFDGAQGPEPVEGRPAGKRSRAVDLEQLDRELMEGLSETG